MELALHRDDVETLPGGGEPPQVCGEAELGVAKVSGDVIEPCRQAHPLGEVVGTPTGDERGVERVGSRLRCSDFGGEALRVVREAGGSRGIAAIDP